MKGFKFFRGRETTKVKAIGAVRAVTMGLEREEIHVTFKSEDASLPNLTLELTPRQARDLIGDMTSAYEAINPPLYRGGSAASWQGMDDR